MGNSKMEVSTTLILLTIIVGVIILFWGSQRSTYTFVQPPGDHRPDPGDFLLTTGNVPTGEGGMVEEMTDISNLTVELCEECVSHCMLWKSLHGLSTDFKKDHVRCLNYCNMECNPQTGL